MVTGDSYRIIQYHLTHFLSPDSFARKPSRDIVKSALEVLGAKG